MALHPWLALSPGHPSSQAYHLDSRHLSPHLADIRSVLYILPWTMVHNYEYRMQRTILKHDRAAKP